MRTDAGKERSIRKANLELLTPGAPKIAPTWPRDAEGAQAPASTAAPVEAARFKTGDLVIIDGLTSKPELNGCKAHVRGSDPAKVGRFVLDLLHNGTQISVKSINCRPPPGHAPFDRKQVARGPSQTTRKRGRAAVETTDESDSPSDQSETEGDGDADDLPDPVQMKRDHEWVGRTVHVRFGHQIMSGKVVGWYPTQGGDEALWHVVHEDDDEEDLDEEGPEDAPPPAESCRAATARSAATWRGLTLPVQLFTRLLACVSRSSAARAPCPSAYSSTCLTVMPPWRSSVSTTNTTTLPNSSAIFSSFTHHKRVKYVLVMSATTTLVFWTMVCRLPLASSPPSLRPAATSVKISTVAMECDHPHAASPASLPVNPTSNEANAAI